MVTKHNPAKRRQPGPTSIEWLRASHMINAMRFRLNLKLKERGLRRFAQEKAEGEAWTNGRMARRAWWKRMLSRIADRRARKALNFA